MFDITTDKFTISGIAETLEEVSISVWFDYLAAYDKTNGGTGIEDVGEWAKFLSLFVKGSLENLPIIGELDIEPDFIMSPFTDIRFVSLYSIIKHYDNLINSYTPDQRMLEEKYYSFFHKGVKYYLHQTDALDKTKLTIGEALTFSELDSATMASIDTEGDIDYSKRYTKTLTLVAVMCRKLHEPLPFDTIERADFIQKRLEIFRDLPMMVVRDIDFFLARKLSILGKAKITSIILNNYQASRETVRLLHTNTKSKSTTKKSKKK